MGNFVHISSLDHISERVIDHLRQGHHTSLVGSPGCGITTFAAGLADKIADHEFTVVSMDALAKGATELMRELEFERKTSSNRHVFVVDHAGRLHPDDCGRLMKAACESTARYGDLCLWCGNLDARITNRQLAVKLCSVPSAHVSFPILTRDELLAVYRAIGDERGCRWGDAVLYLILDFCGTDLALVRSATDYLHGDWSDRLYDESVWDRVQEWLNEDETVDAYRSRLNALHQGCETTLALIRFGGKPQCLRAELNEEVDDDLRRLCLDGFLIPNLLPGYYQLRNLVVRFLLEESVQPGLLFRRATNERVAALLQDAETMLRQVIVSVFTRTGLDAVRERLEAMQQPGEVVDKELNRSLLEWVRRSCTAEAVKELNELLQQHRTEFKKTNSVWATTNEMMRQDNLHDEGSPHIRCIDYLTFDQLGRLVLAVLEEVLPRLPDDLVKKRVRENWQEGVAKVHRLRNQVAHLRNVGFQDMEDVARTLDKMRRDIIDYGGWKDRAVILVDAVESA